MSIANVNQFAGLGPNGTGSLAQCFDGKCSADRADVTTAATFPAVSSPQMTIAAGTYYIAVLLAVPSLIYVGPAVAAAVRDARAQALPAGLWPMTVKPGDVVFIRDL